MLINASAIGAGAPATPAPEPAAITTAFVSNVPASSRADEGCHDWTMWATATLPSNPQRSGVRSRQGASAGAGEPRNLAGVEAQGRFGDRSGAELGRCARCREGVKACAAPTVSKPHRSRALNWRMLLARRRLLMRTGRGGGDRWSAHRWSVFITLPLLLFRTRAEPLRGSQTEQHPSHESWPHAGTHFAERRHRTPHRTRLAS